MTFDWDEANIEHIARHGLEAWEVEEALEDPQALPADAYNYQGERRYGVIGASEARRILFVVYTRRGDKIRPLHARDASAAQKRRYRKG